MKGIVLAGGSGTRLYPITEGMSKQLMPIYDKPMIYYPLTVLMQAGIRDILIITTPEESDNFKRLLSDGAQWGCHFSYAIQDEPRGLADAFIVGESFIGGEPVCLVLGDNIFHGHGLMELLANAVSKPDGASVFGYHVSDPERYGVVEFDAQNQVISIEEKPKHPKSAYAVTGLYFYPSDVVDIAKSLVPSSRGELEITDLNMVYHQQGRLSVELMAEGFAWLDTGTHDSLLEASQFVSVVQRRQNVKIGCPEEIAFHQGWITSSELETLAAKYAKTEYGSYLLRLLSGQAS